MTLLYWPLSDHIRERIKDHEGFNPRCYLCPAGIPTIGWGSTGKDIHLGLTWTPAQCEDRFERDLREVAEGVSGLLKGHPCTRHQFEALVSFAYNLGTRALASSTLLKLHLIGSYKAAQEEFGKWVYAGKPKRRLRGLVERRAEEAEWYGVPDRAPPPAAS